MNPHPPHYRTQAARDHYAERLAIILEAGDVPEARAREIAKREADKLDA